MKFIFILITLFLSQIVVAKNRSGIDKYFEDYQGCFILYNLNTNKIITKYNEKRCAKRISPDSTFKIALSLMAFDQRVINESSVFKWDGKNKGMSQWNHNQTPKTWLQYSVVWVSREITPQLGMLKIKDYLQKFNYGNQDFSGDPGKNNGLEHAWLSSSLQISANEQLYFLRQMLNKQLPISSSAIHSTMNNLYIGKLSNGWSLYGKTGSGWKDTDNYKYVTIDGWFEGFVIKGKQKYIFVTNISEEKLAKEAKPIGASITKDKITIPLLIQLLK
ncbi:MAG: penicillin-binding transpeptidase domain-containing protein [Neisseriaceae bacterium]